MAGQVTSKLPLSLQRLKCTGYKCVCCMDQGRYRFGLDWRDCDRCELAAIDNDILKRLPSTLNDLDTSMDWWLKGTIADRIEILHGAQRVKFKNNGKQGVLIVRKGEQ